MELLSVIRRWHYRDHFSIREISRRTGLSRNTVRKYLRSDTVEPKFNIPDRPSKLDPYADKLSQMLRQEGGKSRKQKRTTKQLHADLAALGYDGSYNRVAAFARDWKAARLREQKTAGRGVFVPLAFMAGEAFQFDWSEDWAITHSSIRLSSTSRAAIERRRVTMIVGKIVNGLVAFHRCEDPHRERTTSGPDLLPMLLPTDRLGGLIRAATTQFRGL